MEQANLSRLKLHSIRKRKSKVNLTLLASKARKGEGFKRFYASLPDILAASKFKSLVDEVISARKKKRPVVFMLGAHVIKCGLSPIIIDLIEKKIITAIALNGAGIVHDFELAYYGETSEDVLSGLEEGSFGMVEETQRYINEAIKSGAANGMGLGLAIGRMIEERKLKNRRLSILRTCAVKGIPATVHVAIGTDITHQSPYCDGASVGEASFTDFKILTSVVSKLQGGCVLNIGSAVLLPEVFLKALTTARNLGHKVVDFTAANLDMIQHYRPNQNVLCRPISLGGRAISLTGHHEIMVPLLYRALIEEI